jgi:outer membrane lipoprotein SlyB
MWTLVIFGTTVLAAGCAAPGGMGDSSSTEGSTLVRIAYVTDIRDVTLHGNQHSTAGSVLGAVLGGIAGSNVGSGYGRGLATAGGAVAGSMAGQRLARTGGTPITRLTVRTEEGDLQTYDVGPEETFRVGDKVRIITNKNLTRITH